MSAPYLWFLSGVILAVLGLITKFITDRVDDTHDINWREFAVVMAVFLIVIDPLSTHIGWNLGKDKHLSYTRHTAGSEVSVNVETITCTKDGPCKWEYACDPYQCNPHDCNCTCSSYDEDGSCESESCDTCYDTCYHDCPYSSCEQNYTVAGIVDGGQSVLYDFGSHRLPYSPQSNRWNSAWDSFEWDYMNSIPESVINAAGVGEPPLWLAVQDRVNRNDPGPVSASAEYGNPIYASESTILQRYSGTVDTFQAQGLLPDPTSELYNYYRVNLVRFVGSSTLDPLAWNQSVEYFNAAFSMELHGDLRLVIVTDPTANTSWADYDLALAAYWEDPNLWGKNPISPSSLMIVLHSSDGTTIDHVFVETGAPSGNDYLVERLKTRLAGQKLDLTAIVGDVHGQINGNTVVYEHATPGIIEDAVFGITDPGTKFEYVDVNSSFSYLIKDIKPTAKQAFWIVFFTVLIGCLGWAAAFAYGEKEWQNGSAFYTQKSGYRRDHFQ